MTNDLTAAGIDPFDESVYRAVLTRRTAAPAELAADLGCSPSAPPGRWTGCTTTAWSGGSRGAAAGTRRSSREPRSSP
ncbi:hypothetical protein STANM309S_03705 [Streptomyces tanashiensis]